MRRENLEDMFGPAAPYSEYRRGDRIAYPGDRGLLPGYFFVDKHGAVCRLVVGMKVRVP